MSNGNNARPELRVTVELGALEGEQTVVELVSRLGVHPPVLQDLKRALFEGALG